MGGKRRWLAEVSQLPERHGRVLDTTGAPVMGALIVIDSGTVPMPEIALLSDENGEFSLRLPPGKFTLRAQGSGGKVGAAEVSGAPSITDINISIGP